MTGGDLKIEVLPAGAVVPAFHCSTRYRRGTLDGGHGVLVYHYGKQTALALWGSGPAYAMDANMLLAWHRYRWRQGAAHQALCLDRRQRRIIPVRPDADAAARLVQEAGHQDRGLHAASSIAPSGSRLTCSPPGRRGECAPGGEIVSAMDRGLLDAAEFNNASSDRALGFADVSKVCMLQSYHQNCEQFEITFNKTKFDSLPDKMKAIIAKCGRRSQR
jgi:TRAP-type mannitol/chloroaromatic compound transport system substrate-binding protein